MTTSIGLVFYGQPFVSAAAHVGRGDVRFR
jgi:hypothetical protein